MTRAQFLLSPHASVTSRPSSEDRKTSWNTLADALVDTGPHVRGLLPQHQVGAKSVYPELHVQFEAEQGVYWQYLAPTRPCFTFGLLRDMRRAIDHVVEIGRESAALNEEFPIRYLVTASRTPAIFNLGGDLLKFVEFIREGDREALRRYAHACIAVQYPRGTNMELPFVSISLVQGDALGGGFEAALADNMIIAERRAKFGFPEVLFGLFPGMGAYSFLSRRIGATKTEEMIMSGRLYTAAEMAELGVVDRVVEDGTGEQAVRDFIRSEERRALARRALYQIRRRVNPVTEAELLDITNLWADTAVRLPEIHLKKMERLARAQERRWSTMNIGHGIAEAD